MEIYIILYALLISFGIYTDNEIINFNKKRILNPNLYLFAFTIVLFIVSSTRIGIGTDYELYKGIYNAAAENSLELGQSFKWFSDLFRLLGLDYQFFIAFNSFIFISIICYFIYNFSEYKYISLITLLGTYSYFSSFNGFRQFSAISLVLLALILCLHKNKKFIGAIVFIIAFGMHKSSIMFLPFFFINYIPLKQKIFLILMFINLFSFFLVPDIFKNLLFNNILNFNEFFAEKYTDTQHAEGMVRGLTNKMFFLFYWIITFKVIVNKIKTNETVNWLDKLFLFYFIINSFLPYSNLVKRISYLFELIALYMMPKFISSNESILLKNVLKAAITIIFLVRLIYVLIQNGDGVVPYETIISFF